MGLKKLGRYDIIRVLGKGAMGMVYEARDPNLERRVAIKTIKVDALSQEATVEYEARFRTEARSAARLQHPHIVSVYDSGRHDDMAYLVMEFVQGDDLKQLLDRGVTFSLAQSTHIMCDLLSALDYAHRQNIVHRDVKPANLLVEADGRVKLTDFGVARIQDAGDATRTRGSMVGTLKYMAPEQVQGLAVDARADIFAAGVLLYQLLTGRRPFDGESDFAIIQQIVASAPAPPSTVNMLLPAAIDSVVAQALAPSREQRFASAQAFAVALEAAIATVADQTIVPPPGKRPAVEWGATGANAMRRSARTGGSTAVMGDTSGSTVTQELELVYWKDVKDSDDEFDLQGFLDRFPHGIYGDLARRRLKRLGGRERGEQTGTALQTRVMDRDADHAGFSDTEQMGEKTVLVERNHSGVGSAPDSEFDQTLAVAPDLPAIADAPVQPPAAVEAAAEPGNTATAPSHSPEPPAAAQHPLQTPAPAQPIRRWAMWACLVVAVAMAMWAYGPVGDPEPVQTSAPLGVPSAGEDRAGSAAVPTSEAGVASQSLAVAAPKAAAAAASNATNSAATPVQAAAPSLPGKPMRSTGSPPRAAVAGAPSNPKKACEGRVLLGFQTCMNDQCASAEFAGHSICRQRRMAEDARAAQQNNRN